MLARWFFGERVGSGLQVDALDGVRGLAVWIVLSSHIANREILLWPGHRIAGDGSGKYGVYLFFVLSAFLLTRALLRIDASQMREPATWLQYGTRRFLRIYPLYTGVLAFVMLGLWQGWLPGREKLHDFVWRDFFEHLLLQDGQIHFWTIAVEVKYYLVIPFVAAFHRGYCRADPWRTTRYLVGVVATLALLWLVVPSPSRISLLRYLPIFLGGSLAACFHESWGRHPERAPDAATWRIVASGAVVITILLFPVVLEWIGLPAGLPLHPSLSAVWGVVFGALVLAAVREDGAVSRLFASRPARLLGIVSFSAYLWHWFVLEAVAQASWSDPVRLLVFYAATFALACASYLAIERPLSRLAHSPRRTWHRPERG